MTELRKNLITDDWVIIAKDRSARPCEYSYENKNENIISKYKEDCPFCPGNEKFTPETILTLNDKNKQWKFRVIPNKYPALENKIQIDSGGNDQLYKIQGFGFHEVVVESNLHNAEPAFYSQNDFSCLLDIYRKRYLYLKDIKEIKSIIIFKNHGKNAGTSLEHPHSQIVAMPFVPKLIHHRVNIAANYFKKNSKCIFCDNLNSEINDKDRIIFETDLFVAFIPFAALSPYHLWIFPKIHTSTFSEITKAEIDDLAKILKKLLQKLYVGLNNPDYNLIIRSVLDNTENFQHFHWYVSIIPRINKSAGFELSTGTFINPSLPEESANFLRNIEI